MKHSQFTPLVICLAVSLVSIVGSGCQLDDEPPIGDGDLRDVYFDGVQIQADLAENPDAVFFADLRDGSRLHFDQREAPIDFSHFIFQCPSMPAPVEMRGFMNSLDGDFLESEFWSMYSMTAVEEEFRAVIRCEGQLVCADNDGPPDCFCVE